MNRNILVYQIPPHQTFACPQANQFPHPIILSYSPLQKFFQNSICLKEINSFLLSIQMIFQCYPKMQDLTPSQKISLKSLKCLGEVFNNKALISQK